MMDIVVRKMRHEDMDAVLRILASWNMAPIAPSADNPDPERSMINVENSFVAVAGSRIVGVCSYIVHSEELAETASLAVDPEYKGKGIGYRLQLARLEELRSRGIKKVRTETDRPETIDWYITKFNYKKVGRNRKKHAFSLEDVEYWTVLELDLE